MHDRYPRRSPATSSRAIAMNKVFLLLGLGLLSFTIACGSSGGGNNNSFGGGNNSNSKLSGQYAYQLSGIDLSTGSFFREAGVFTADGNGNITAGTDDFAEGTSVSLAVTTTGTYSISSDGTGSGVFNFANGSSLTFAFTVVDSSQIDLIEVDGLATAGGTARLQTASAFSAPPSGTFAFRLHTFGTTADSSVGAVGAFTVANGTITGNEDVERTGTLSSLPLSGSFNFPDATSGRGTGTFDDGVATTPFAYYMIDSSTVLLFSTNAGTNGLGQVEKQTATSFNTASLSGGYAFGSRGDTATVDAVRTVGSFTADGSGNISAGALDSVQDGTSSTNVTLTGSGSYTMASNGRAAVTLPASTGTIQEIYWMVSPSRAFFLVDDSTKVEDGTADLQSGSFSNSSVNGTYVFLNDGYTLSTSDTFDRVGTLTADGSGTLVVNYAVNVTGSASTVTLNGSYSVASNGRMTGSVNSLSNNLVFYLVSGNQAYILQNDSGAEIDGSMLKQQ